MVEITLYHGDCITVMKELPDKSVDLILCDLPYGCLSANQTIHDKNVKSGKRVVGRVHDACRWDVKINLDDFWKEIKRIRKNDHTPCIHFCTTKFGYDLIKSNPNEFRYDLVWNKLYGVSFLSANRMPMRSHEMIYIFSKAGSYYERVDRKGDFEKWVRPQIKDEQGALINRSTHYGATRIDTEGGDKSRCVLSVVNIKKQSTSHHPTQKPEEIYRWLIERYCPVGGLVLDPTFGSGNALFTAYAMGRSAVGMEKDDAFFAKAEEHLNQL